MLTVEFPNNEVAVITKVVCNLKSFSIKKVHYIIWLVHQLVKWFVIWMFIIGGSAVYLLCLAITGPCWAAFSISCTTGAVNNSYIIDCVCVFPDIYDYRNVLLMLQ
jgi:hypothetical protein